MSDFFFFKWKENIVFFRVRSTISVGGARALDELRTYFAPSTQSSAEKTLSTTASVGYFHS